MRIVLRYFGPAADASGAATQTLDLPAGTTLAQLSAQLQRQAALFATARLAVNRRFAPPDTPLRDGDEVALIPPVSGG